MVYDEQDNIGKDNLEFTKNNGITQRIVPYFIFQDTYDLVEISPAREESDNPLEVYQNTVNTLESILGKSEFFTNNPQTTESAKIGEDYFRQLIQYQPIKNKIQKPTLFGDLSIDINDLNLIKGYRLSRKHYIVNVVELEDNNGRPYILKHIALPKYFTDRNTYAYVRDNLFKY